jgi:hypothetical protein
VDEKATQLHAIASLKVLLDATKPHNGAATTSAANHVTVAQRLDHETQLAALQEQPNGVASGLEDAAAVDTVSFHNRSACYKYNLCSHDIEMLRDLMSYLCMSSPL